MFPIVPLTRPFASPATISGFATGASTLLVPGRVTAAEAIALGAVSAPLISEELMGRPDVVQISVCLSLEGAIELEKFSKEIWSQDCHWIRALRLSDDCHSYNVQLRFENSSKNLPRRKLVLEAVRPIQVGQELLLWFSEDVLANLQIAFLTPSNIQGQKKYVCTKCSALYESPNPLKLHISLNCGSLPITSLWERLLKVHPIIENEEIVQEEVFNFKLSSDPTITRQRNAMDLSVSSTNHNREENIYRPYNNENSAFKPFRKLEIESSRNNYLMPVMENVQIWSLPSFPPQNINIHQGDGEAQIETLVSSLGKSKQGHICLYCGKCYSRKYGLKIHIRTHTGYKPLKCKFCMRPFGDPSNLNKHVRLHAEGNTPYKCDLCGKILVRRRDLDRHLKSRHMVEMHPGVNILRDASTPESDVLVKSESDVAA